MSGPTNKTVMVGGTVTTDTVNTLNITTDNITVNQTISAPTVSTDEIKVNVIQEVDQLQDIGVAIETVNINNGNITKALSLHLMDASNNDLDIGLIAANNMIESYSLTFPSSAPLSNQSLRSFINVPYTNLQWQTDNNTVLPVITRCVAVSKSGSDSSGNGSFAYPYLTLSGAINYCNSLAPLGITVTNPMCILVEAGIYFEDNSLGPLEILLNGVSILGLSAFTTYALPNTVTNDFFRSSYTMHMTDITLASNLTNTAPNNTIGRAVVLNGANNQSTFFATRFLCFGTGADITGTGYCTYEFDYCFFRNNYIGMNIDNVYTLLGGTKIQGSNPYSLFTPANTGLIASGSNCVAVVSTGLIFGCDIGFHFTTNSDGSCRSIEYRNNTIDALCDGASTTAFESCVFKMNLFDGDTDVQASGAGTTVNLLGCAFNGRNLITGLASGKGVFVEGGAKVNFSSSNLQYYENAVIVGDPIGNNDTNDTSMSMSAVSFGNSSVNDVGQYGTATLLINSCELNHNLVFINNPQNVNLWFLDTDPSSDNTMVTGRLSDVDHTILQFLNGDDSDDYIQLNYDASFNNTTGQGIGFLNKDIESDFIFFNTSQNNATISNMSLKNTCNTSLQLVSNNNSSDGLRGWTFNRSGANADLLFEYQNNDVSLTTVPIYTLLQLDGNNRNILFPDNTSKLLFGAGGGDTNFYRSAANVLKTDGNFVVSGLTNTNSAVYADANKQLTASTTSATELGYLSGTTSNVQTQMNSKFNTSGGLLTGNVTLPSGSTSSPSLNFTNSQNTTGLSCNTNILSFSNSGSESMSINAVGTVKINSMAGGGNAGILHSDNVGNLSSSLIINNNITDATIANSKLATISSGNTNGAIVVRDNSGNFITHMITLNGQTTNATDAATKAYVDTAVGTALEVLAPAMVVSITNVSSLSGLQTIDGITLSTNDRVLLVGQTSSTNNGLWLASSSTWTRPTDFSNGNLAQSSYVLVLEGTIYAGSSWVCVTPTAVIGTDSIQFQEFSLPSQTTGNNVGSGAGVYKNNTGVVLNFRSILATGGSHLTVTSNTNDISFTTDATSNNTADTLVARDSSGNFTATQITASLTGASSLNVLKSGDAMSGTLTVPAGTVGGLPFNFVGQSTTGVFANSNSFNIVTNGVSALTLDASQNVFVNNLTSAGVVHTSATTSDGQLTTSLITNSDIASNAAIVDTKLATISTANKVSNSATTATNNNTVSTIVARDVSGNFAANIITAATLNGAASANVLKTGDTMTGALILPTSVAGSSPQLTFTNNTTTGISAINDILSFETSGNERFNINAAGVITIDAFSTAAVLHNNASGNLTSSLIVNNDITTGTIQDSKLATISTAGKVSNTATTAISTNNVSTIVLRDVSGNFSCGTITASLTGNASTATTATNVATIANTASATSFFPTFVANSTTNSSTPLDVSSGFSFIPSTAVLTTTGGFSTTSGSISTSTGNVTTTPTSNSNNTSMCNTTYVDTPINFMLGCYQTLLEASGYFTSAKSAGTYGLNTDNLVIVSGGTAAYLYKTIYLSSADYAATINGKTPKLIVRGTIFINNTAVTGSYTLALYPVSATNTSGNGVLGLSLGTVVSGSSAGTWTASALLQNTLTGSNFSFPATNLYCLGVVSSVTPPNNSNVTIQAKLQLVYG